MRHGLLLKRELRCDNDIDYIRTSYACARAHQGGSWADALKAGAMSLVEAGAMHELGEAEKAMRWG